MVKAGPGSARRSSCVDSTARALSKQLHIQYYLPTLLSCLPEGIDALIVLSSASGLHVDDVSIMLEHGDVSMHKYDALSMQLLNMHAELRE
eukprot:3216379-Lingulodinium_polyedra.AAC.1